MTRTEDHWSKTEILKTVTLTIINYPYQHFLHYTVKNKKIKFHIDTYWTTYTPIQISVVGQYRPSSSAKSLWSE